MKLFLLLAVMAFAGSLICSGSASSFLFFVSGMYAGTAGGIMLERIRAS